MVRPTDSGPVSTLWLSATFRPRRLLVHPAVDGSGVGGAVEVVSDVLCNTAVGKPVKVHIDRRADFNRRSVLPSFLRVVRVYGKNLMPSTWTATRVATFARLPLAGRPAHVAHDNGP